MQAHWERGGAVGSAPAAFLLRAELDYGPAHVNTGASTAQGVHRHACLSVARPYPCTSRRSCIVLMNCASTHEQFCTCRNTHTHTHTLARTHLGEQRDLAKVLARPQQAHHVVVLAQHAHAAPADDVHLQA